MIMTEANEEAQSIETPPASKIQTKVEEGILSSREKINGIPEEQRWLVNKDWINVLKMMDSMDHGPGKDNQHYPHLETVIWQRYHLPTQQPGTPFPNSDGSLSEFQRQLVTSQEWITRLAGEIDPLQILDFPIVEGPRNHHTVSEYLQKNDPEWVEIVHEVSQILEPGSKEAGIQGVGFGLTEENYSKLDTPRKKAAAFLLLRSRLSSIVSSALSDMVFSADKNGRIEDITAVESIFQNEQSKGSLRPITKAFFESKMGERSMTQWVGEVFRNPLLTSTESAFFEDRNDVRSNFIVKAEVVLQGSDV